MCVAVVVAARLCNINLSRFRPLPIHRVNGHQPDGGPQPISRGKCGCDFNTTILYCGTLFGVDPTRLDRVDDRSVGKVGDSMTVGPDVRGANTLLLQIEDVVGVDEVGIL